MDGESVYAGRDRLGGDDGELLAVRAVFVKSVDHLPANGSRSGPFEFEDLLCFRRIRVQRSVLTSAVTKENDQVVGLAAFDLLRTHECRPFRCLTCIKVFHVYV